MLVHYHCRVQAPRSSPSNRKLLFVITSWSSILACLVEASSQVSTLLYVSQRTLDVVGPMKFLSITCKLGERCPILHVPIGPTPFLTLLRNFLVCTYGPIILLPSATLCTFSVSSTQGNSSTCTTFKCLQTWVYGTTCMDWRS